MEARLKVPQSEIEAEMTEVIERLTNSTYKNPNYIGFASHTPFRLEVSAEDIANGFFDNLWALQGYRNTWYTGASMNSQSLGELFNFIAALLPRIVEAL